MRASSRVEPDEPTTGVPAHPAVPAAGALRGLVDRFEGIVHELGKFGAVGAATYVMDTVIFKLALSAGMYPLLAKTLSTTVAATAAFIGNRHWTWRDRPRSGLHREYALYFVFNVVGLGIGLACLSVSHYLLGRLWPVFTTQLADLVSANVIGMALGTLFRFWSYRRFVFRRHSAIDDPDAPQVK